MIRDLIGEVVGLSHYEKRLLDMLKTGGASSEKRMYKFAKRRVSLLGKYCFSKYAVTGTIQIASGKDLCLIYFPTHDPNIYTYRYRYTVGHPQESA